MFSKSSGAASLGCTGVQLCRVTGFKPETDSKSERESALLPAEVNVETAEIRRQQVAIIEAAEAMLQAEVKAFEQDVEMKAAKIRLAFDDFRHDLDMAEQTVLTQLRAKARDVSKLFKVHGGALEVYKQQATACNLVFGSQISTEIPAEILLPTRVPRVNCVFTGIESMKSLASQCWKIVETSCGDDSELKLLDAKAALTDVLANGFHATALHLRKERASVVATVIGSTKSKPFQGHLVYNATVDVGVDGRKLMSKTSGMVVAVNPEGTMLAISDGSFVSLVSVATAVQVGCFTPKQLAFPSKHHTDIRALCFGPDGNSLIVNNNVVGGTSSPMTEMSLTGELYKRTFAWPMAAYPLRGGGVFVSRIQIALKKRNGRRVIGALITAQVYGERGFVALYDYCSGHLIAELGKISSAPTDFAFLCDGSSVVFACHRQLLQTSTSTVERPMNWMHRVLFEWSEVFTSLCVVDDNTMVLMGDISNRLFGVVFTDISPITSFKKKQYEIISTVLPFAKTDNVKVVTASGNLYVVSKLESEAGASHLRVLLEVFV